MKPEQDLRRLRACVEKAGEIATWPEDRLYAKDDRVSAWSSAQHLDHVGQVLVRVLRTVEALRKGDDERILPEGRPTFAARMLLLTGWIPRGRGEAPAEVLPDPRPVRHRVREVLGQAALAAERLEAEASTLATVEGCFPHPALGAFDAAEWVRFAFVHTKHHLTIIQDIDRKRTVGVPDETGAPREEEGPREARASSP